jgi:hypothetical protein
MIFKYHLYFYLMCSRKKCGVLQMFLMGEMEL